MTQQKYVIPAAIGMMAIALMAMKEPKRSNLAQQWQIVPDYKSQDSIYLAELKGIDTLSAFPPEFVMMREQLAKMTPEDIAQISAETVEVLKMTNLDSFKMKARTYIIKNKKQQDELEKTRANVYDFQQNGIVKMFATDKPEDVDTSTGWKEDVKKKEILLYMNPNMETASGNLPKDTIRFQILHLSSDSLSIKALETNFIHNAKPMNFKKYLPGKYK